MKAIHNKIEKKDLSLKQWLMEAREMEAENKETAVREYKRIALAYPKNENVYNRLMILFRQLKQPKNEIYWINKAIDNFQAGSKKSKVSANSRIAKLSKSISHALGLLDKTGNPIYHTVPYGTW